MPTKMRSKSRGVTSMAKDRYFIVNVKLLSTNEIFALKNVHNEMKIGEMKSYSEFITGVPKHIQRIRYLDQGDLLDHTDVRQNDIVANAQLSMEVWNMWNQLIEAVATNDMDWVFKLGVTEDSDYNTPNSEYMSDKNRKQWLADRAFVALYIAAHRGHLKLVEKLIAAGANLNSSTPLNRTALHVAASQGHGTIVDTLLENGADIDAEDSEGHNALSIASRFGHKGCERHLFLFRWQQRAKATRPQVSHDMFAHQYFDSALPVWLKGEQAQIYFTQILPPGEYEGTALNAPKRQGEQQSGDHGEDVNGDEQYVPSGPDDERRESQSGLSAIKEEAQQAGRADKKQKEKIKSFDAWLAKKEAEDQVRMAREKEDRRRKKQVEDEKKGHRSVDLEQKKAAQMKAELEDKSYEQWLSEREAASRKANRQASKIQAATGGRTTDDIIRSLEERSGSGLGIPSDLWKHVRDPTKYQEIQYRGLMLLENYTAAQEAAGKASATSS